MPTLHANGIEIWYDFLGDGAETLVLNHGWLGPTEGWPGGVFDLAKRHRLLVYDVRGQGKTSVPLDAADYSMPQYAADLRALMDALDIERAHIAGVSQGGMITWQFACDYPERVRTAVISDSTAGNGMDEGPGGEWERTMQRGLARAERYVREEGLVTFCERKIAFDAKNETHYLEHPESPEVRQDRERQRYARLTPEAYVGTNRAIRERPDLTARIPQLTMPALIMVGEWDDFRPCAERDHSLVEGSRFVLARRSGHSIDTWRPDVFASEVLRFLADVASGREIAGACER
jgi:pimeloyl-ACP methyl ester carboxylesterase